MQRKEILDRIRKYVHPFRITNGKGFRLKDFDPADTRGLKMDKGEAAGLLQRGTEWLAEEQGMLYAQDRWSLLLVFQAMDAAGKDSTIKHVMSGVNPQGCQVYSFKQPSSEDLDHDFMWRYVRRLPERGRIGIFNRSYYEEVLVVRVHQDILQRQKLPATARRQAHLGRAPRRHRAFRGLPRPAGNDRPQVLPQRLAQGAEEALPGAPRHAGEELEVLRRRRARAQVLGRLHARLRASHPRDGVRARAVVCRAPADNKWFTRLVVEAAIVEAVEGLDLAYPKVSAEKKKELEAARAELAGED